MAGRGISSNWNADWNAIDGMLADLLVRAGKRMLDSTLLVGLIGALAGSALTTGTQLFLSRQAHKQQVERDIRAHEQSVRDDKRERMRQYFARIYSAAYVYLTFAQNKQLIQMSITVGTGNLVEQNNLIYGELHKADTETQEALAILALEGGNDEIVEAYVKVKAAFANFMKNKSGDDSELAASFLNLRRLMQLRYGEIGKIP